MAISFPSTEYFEALKAQMAANEEKFRRLGFIDTTFGVSVGVNGKARNFVLEFEVFDLKNVSEVPAIDLKKVDFQIEGDSNVWREMIEISGATARRTHRTTSTRSRISASV